MKGRRSIIVIEDFYSDPSWVREYALKQDYYLPYQDEEKVEKGLQTPTWWTSWYKPASQCPFKSSKLIIERLQDAIGEKINTEHWNATYPVTNRSKPIASHPDARKACLWHCSLHSKHDSKQTLGYGVHNHTKDIWNSAGRNGFAGLIYLAEDAPLNSGLNLWKNINPANLFDWMTPPENWIHLDSFANIYNRLILVRGDIPHSGSNGWGENILDGRFFQTFFFQTAEEPRSFQVSLSRSDLGI